MVLNRTRSILLHIFLLALCSVLLQVILTHSVNIFNLSSIMIVSTSIDIPDFFYGVYDLLRENLQGQDEITTGGNQTSAKRERIAEQRHSSGRQVETFRRTLAKHHVEPK